MPQQNILIRRAEARDIDSLVELAKTTFTDTYRLLDDPADIEDYVTRHFTPAIFASILQDAVSALLVAKVPAQESLVGYIHIQHSNAPACVRGPAPMELTRLYLRQEAIGKGYGTLLMQAVIDEAQRSKCQTIWLSVYDRNERAVEFYKRYGFLAVGTKEFYFGGKIYNDPIMSVSVSRDDR